MKRRGWGIGVGDGHQVHHRRIKPAVFHRLGIIAEKVDNLFPFAMLPVIDIDSLEPFDLSGIFASLDSLLQSLQCCH